MAAPISKWDFFEITPILGQNFAEVEFFPVRGANPPLGREGDPCQAPRPECIILDHQNLTQVIDFKSQTVYEGFTRQEFEAKAIEVMKEYRIAQQLREHPSKNES